MSDNRQIKYTATVDDNPFAAGMARVGNVLEGVKQRMGGTGSHFKGVAEGMSAQMGKVTESVRDSVSGMGGHFSTLLGTLGKTQAGFVGLIGVAAVLAASKAVNATAQMTEGAMDLARVLGTSTNKAQQWRIALEDVGATQGDLEGAAKGMSRQLKENESGMQAMGLKTRDAAGNLRPMTDLLVDGIAVMNRHKEGADRAMAGQEIFGRGVDASSKLLLVNKEVMTEAERTMKEFGLEVGGNATSAWNEFDAATDRAGFGMKGLVNTAGKILMPVLTDLVKVFNTAMPLAITVVQGALGGLATAFHAIKNGVRVVWEVINAMVISVAEPIRAIAEAIGLAITGDFKGAGAAVKNIGDVISTAWGNAMNNMAESSQKTRDRIAAIWGADTEAGKPVGERGTDDYVDPKKGKGKGGKEKPEEPGSLMQYYEFALAEEKRFAAEKDALREYSKQDEIAYWQFLLESQLIHGKDRMAISKKVAELELQVMRENAKQRKALDAQALEGQQQRALDAVEAARVESRGMFELGQITNQQLLEQERTFEEQRTEVRRQYLAARLAMIDPDRDPVAYEQINLQIEELERGHLMRLRQIQIEVMGNAQDNPISRVWQAAQRSMETAITGMINRTMSLRQAMASLWGGIRQAIVGEIAKIMAAKIAAWAKDRALALMEIGANAIRAGSGAAASQAGIPYVGPVLAIAAMAAIMAAVMGTKGSVPSARAGFDIPAGLNPLTQLHEREMVLPAAQADAVRNMADSGSQATAQPLQLHIHSPDAEGVRRLFLNNTGALVDAMKQAHRDFRFTAGRL